MAELHPTTKRDFMKAALAASALLAAGGYDRFSTLVAEYFALEDEYRTYPDDVPLDIEVDWLGRVEGVEKRLSETPIASKRSALDAVRLVNFRLENSEANDLDRAMLRNVQLFMEG